MRPEEFLNLAKTHPECASVTIPACIQYYDAAGDAAYREFLLDTAKNASLSTGTATALFFAWKETGDEMYEKASMHNENGAWQMIFGVNTLPAYRKQGYAGELIREAIRTAKNQGRKGLVLTCKDALVPYYTKFGFQNEGISGSVHGNVVWNQMRLVF